MSVRFSRARIAKGVALAVLATVTFMGARTGEAGEAYVTTSSRNFAVPVTSLMEARFRTVVQQRYDFSCGSAALATLLTHHYDRPTTEQEVFRQMYKEGDQERIRKQGFSMLDMKNYLESHGYRADGFRVSLDTLARVGVPAIVLTEIRGYRHFVVIKGIRNNEVLVGDPAFGIKVYRRDEFKEILVSDVIFVIRRNLDQGRKHFNDQGDWAVQGRAPFGTALSRQTLGSFSLMLPGRNEF